MVPVVNGRAYSTVFSLCILIPTFFENLKRRYEVSGSKAEIERLKKRIEILETRVENLMRNAIKFSEKNSINIWFVL